MRLICLTEREKYGKFFHLHLLMKNKEIGIAVNINGKTFTKEI